MPDFICRSVTTLKKLGLEGQCLHRLDSGNDAEENFDTFGKDYFLVKRNLRKESREQWLALARRVGNKQAMTVRASMPVPLTTFTLEK